MVIGLESPVSVVISEVFTALQVRPHPRSSKMLTRHARNFRKLSIEMVFKDILVPKT